MTNPENRRIRHFLPIAWVCLAAAFFSWIDLARAQLLIVDTRCDPEAHAGLGMFDTGVVVGSGDLVHISTTGAFHNGAQSVPSPDGLANSPDPEWGETLLPHIAACSLVGR